MARAWACIDNVEHGAFLQDGLDFLCARGVLPKRDLMVERYACPRCVLTGGAGFMRPATSTEVARIAANHGGIIG